MESSYLPPVPPATPRRFGLLSELLARTGGRRALSAVTALLVVAGVGLFAYPVFTDIWASHHQQQLRHQFSSELASPAYRQAYLEGRIAIGEGLTELEIPKLSVNVLVVQGTTSAALRAGAGHYVNTPLPGERGNVGIAGHRTTYGRPFNRLAEMRPGDKVVLITPIATYTYSVVPPFGGHANPWVVLPTDVGVVAQTGALGTGHWLTLTTCNPKGSAAQRLILRLTLVSAVPRAVASKRKP